MGQNPERRTHTGNSHTGLLSYNYFATTRVGCARSDAKGGGGGPRYTARPRYAGRREGGEVTGVTTAIWDHAEGQDTHAGGSHEVFPSAVHTGTDGVTGGVVVERAAIDRSATGAGRLGKGRGGVERKANEVGIGGRVSKANNDARVTVSGGNVTALEHNITGGRRSI